MDSFLQAWDKFSQNVINLLPKSPFADPINSLSGLESVMGYVNWLVPVGTIIDIALGWLAAITTYYVVMVILRWLKVIGD